MDRAADGGSSRPMADISSVVVTCCECGRTRMIFPNEHDGVPSERPAEAFLTGLFCSGCRGSGQNGKRLLAAPTWRSAEVESGRARMARLLQPIRSGARL